MAIATNRSPVSSAHPITGQFVTIVKGAEFADDDPIVKAQAWAFAAVDEPAFRASVPIAEVEAEVERATRAPGEKRSTRRGTHPA